MQGIRNSSFPEALFNILEGVFKVVQTGTAVWEDVHPAVSVVNLSPLFGEAHYFFSLKLRSFAIMGLGLSTSPPAVGGSSQMVGSLAGNGGRKVFDTDDFRYDSLQKSCSIPAFSVLGEAKYADVVTPTPVLYVVRFIFKGLHLLLQLPKMDNIYNNLRARNGKLYCPTSSYNSLYRSY